MIDLDYPSNLPALHKYLKEQHKGTQDDLNATVTALFETPARIEPHAVSLLRLNAERHVLNEAIEALRRQSTVGDQNPTARARMLKAVMQDRMFETIGLGGTLMGQAIEGEKAKAYRHVIRVIDHVTAATERAE